MFHNLIIYHIKRYTHWLIEPSLHREFLGLHSGMFTNWYTFINLEAKYHFTKGKIVVAFCSLKQELLYIYIYIYEMHSGLKLPWNYRGIDCPEPGASSAENGMKTGTAQVCFIRVSFHSRVSEVFLSPELKERT